MLNYKKLYANVLVPSSISNLGSSNDDEKNFKGLFYQNRCMSEMFEKFPKLLLVQATYILIDLRIPVYLLLVLDGDA